ncbi:MAG: hypothetical protein IPH18_05260 [Chitinophagaceae bacterium]|nr:hypothetical protein [Chitinophagaceae bacterium]
MLPPNLIGITLSSTDYPQEGNLVFANQSYIKRIRNDKLETLAGHLLPWQPEWRCAGTSINNAKLLWIDTNNQVEFLNCHRVASLQGKISGN